MPGVLLTSEQLWDLPLPAEDDPAFLSRLNVLLGYLPTYERDDPIVRRFAIAYIRELMRIDYALALIRDAAIAGSATIANGGLERWESLFGIVPDASATEAERIGVLRGHIAARDVGSSEKWIAVLKLLAQSEQMQITKTGRSVTVRIPGEEGAAGETAMAQLIRAIIPAHLAVDVDFISGFNVDVSRVDYGVI
jgi:hypothetical protein